MPRAEVVVSSVRQCLERAERTLPADAAEVARDYLTAVETVNTRLRRCVQLLRRGLRSEAVHEAEIAPAVLEEAATLDLPQVDQWRELCAANSLPVAPAVDRDAAVEIDEAFPKEQQLKRLLVSHRRLALARAPLAARIKVLRQLSRKDSGTHIWGDDLLTFETARHKQIAEEVTSAMSRNDTAALQALDVECGEVWLEAPPASLSQSIKRALASLQTRDARDQLVDIVARITQAKQAGMQDELSDLLNTWRTVRKQAHLKPDPEQDPIVAEAHDWLVAQLDAQQRDAAYADAVRSVEHALDEQHSMERLERQWAHLVTLERPIPRVLQQRYEARLRESKVIASRRFKLRAMLVAAGILLAAGLVSGLIYWGIAAREQQTWDRQIRTALEAGRLPEAAKLLAQLEQGNAALWQLPTFQSLQTQVDTAIETDRIRQQRFDAALAAAEQAGLRTPDREAIRLAEQLVGSESDKSRLDAVQQRVRQYALKTQMERDRELSAALSDLRRKVTEARRQADAHGVAALPALQEVQRELTEALAGQDPTNPLVVASEPLTSSVAALVAELEQELQRGAATEQATAALRRLYKQPAQLAEKLRAFSQQFPDHPWSAELLAASRTVVADAEVAAWGNAFPQLASNDPVRDKATADAISQRMAKYLEEHPQCPYQSAAAAFDVYLKRASTALDRDAGPTSSDGVLTRMLDHPLIADVYMLVDITGNRFYSHSKDRPKPWGEGRVLVTYMSSYEEALGERPPRSRNFAREQFDTNMTPVLSPQSIFHRDAVALNKTLSWQTRHLSLLDLLHKERDIDPILKLMMAIGLARLSSRYDAQMSADLGEWVTQADAFTADTPWMDPEASGAKDARDEAQQFLANMPSTVDMIDQISKNARAIQDAVAPRQAVGLLWQEADGTRSLSVALPPDASGELHAVHLDDASWQFVNVGQVTEGKMTLNEIAARLPLGTILYMKSPSE